VFSLPHVDARSPQQPLLHQTALLRFDDAAIMFTASWTAPSLPVPRPGGAYRRQYLVHLIVPYEHRLRAFNDVRSVALYPVDDQEPMVVTDFGGVHARDLTGVTLALFADESGSSRQ
jgi:hypothetical protein